MKKIIVVCILLVSFGLFFANNGDKAINNRHVSSAICGIDDIGPIPLPPVHSHPLY